VRTLANYRSWPEAALDDGPFSTRTGRPVRLYRFQRRAVTIW